MSNYRTGLRNFHNETCFSIPLNGISNKRRMPINKRGLSQEIEFSLSCSSVKPINKNLKTCTTKSIRNSNLISKPYNFSKQRNNIVPVTYNTNSNKTSSGDIDDNETVYNDSISVDNRSRLKSPTSDLDDDLPSFNLSPISPKKNTLFINGIPFDNVNQNFDNDNDNNNNNDITDDITLCLSNDTTTDEKSFIIHRPKINILKKCKSFDVDYIVEDFVFFNDIKPVKEDPNSMFESSNDFNNNKTMDELTEVVVVEDIKGNDENSMGVLQDQGEEIVNLSLSNEQKSGKDKIKDELKSNLNEEIKDDNFSCEELKLPKEMDVTIPHYMEPEQDESLEEEESSIGKGKQDQLSSSFSSTFSSVSNEEVIPTDFDESNSLETEEMLLQFVVSDEQEKTCLQQTIIDQTTQRLNEKQKEADRLTNKIKQQKIKMKEHRARQLILSHQLELNHRQSAELRMKLSYQYERSQQQQKEINYYKEMNSRYMEANRLLQEQIRELTKLKNLKV